MKTKFLTSTFMFLLSISLIVNFVQAASVTISQSGADSGSVMKGRAFTVTVSGLSDSGTVTLVLPTGISTSEGNTKSFASSTTSVSWTTVVADQKVSGTSISATITIAGSPSAATSSSFDVILPPSLSATVSPSSTSVERGSTFSLSINIQNSGETTARFGSITVSPSDFSISSGCSPSDILGSGSAGVSCTIAASSSATLGSNTLTISISPTNADSVTKTVSVTVSEATVTTTPGGGSPGSGGSSGGTTGNKTHKKTQTWTKITPGAATIMKIVDPEIGLKQINITVRNSAQTVTITVTKLDGKPASVVHEVSGKIYKYIEINADNINETHIDKVKMQFEVNKSWINANSIDPNTIALNRYKNGWEKLTTKKTSEDNDFVYYEAETTGFSTFAISGEVMAGVTTTTVPGVITTVPTITTIPSITTVPTLISEKGMSPLIIIGIIIVIAIIGFWLYKSRLVIK
jgi:PGF-pre-PGF domain-containing protein